MRVPIVDLDRDPVVVAAELDEICREIGFLQIVAHGVDTAVADDAWHAAHAFFDLPLADRMTVAMPTPGYPYGYSPMSGETLGASLGTVGPADLKESFNAGPFGAGEAEVYRPTPWPDAVLPELRVAWRAYYAEMLALGARLMSLAARGLGLAPEFFGERIDRSPSSLRALNYPAQEVRPEPGQLRAGAHTDYGMLTMLRQDDAPGGLQVRAGAEWVDVPSVPGAYVVNIGDLLARWTNDRWRSTLHRVVNPPEAGSSAAGSSTRRQSMPFFHNTNYDARIECLPTCVGAGPRYEPVVAGPYLMDKFRATVT